MTPSTARRWRPSRRTARHFGRAPAAGPKPSWCLVVRPHCGGPLVIARGVHLRRTDRWDLPTSSGDPWNHSACVRAVHPCPIERHVPRADRGCGRLDELGHGSRLWHRRTAWRTSAGRRSNMAADAALHAWHADRIVRDSASIRCQGPLGGRGGGSPERATAGSRSRSWILVQNAATRRPTGVIR